MSGGCGVDARPMLLTRSRMPFRLSALLPRLFLLVLLLLLLLLGKNEVVSDAVGEEAASYLFIHILITGI